MHNLLTARHPSRDLAPRKFPSKFAAPPPLPRSGTLLAPKGKNLAVNNFPLWGFPLSRRGGRFRLSLSVGLVLDRNPLAFQISCPPLSLLRLIVLLAHKLSFPAALR